MTLPRIPIRNFEDREDWREPDTPIINGILRLPGDEDMMKVKEDLGQLQPDAILTPYYLDPAGGPDWSSTARAAAMYRGAFSDLTVMAPVAAFNKKEARSYIEMFQDAGFAAFAIPESLGGVPVQHIAGFWETSGILWPNVWYHIAGSETGDAPIAEVSGHWTFSEENL